MPLRLARLLGGCLVLCLAIGARAQGLDEQRAAIETAVETGVRQIAAELSVLCPLADPADQKALEACRGHLFRGSLLRRSLAPILLWGRLRPGVTLKDTPLTQFAPEAWTGLYAPMFMFDGTWRLDYDKRERLYRARLGTLFRNALDPGQYPYPFWHDARKWNGYQAADTLILWIAPLSVLMSGAISGAIVAGQFATDGRDASRSGNTPVTRPPFDGQWMWTDATGASQPAPTLFRGLFSQGNPYLGQLEPAYRELADAMRRGQCNDCHVPTNPARMSRLVLLQTPAHAASEIKRLMKTVRDNEMPLDDSLLYHEIHPDTRVALLDHGAVFEALIDAARAWEEARPSPR
jgi:hypothetical protein